MALTRSTAGEFTTSLGKVREVQHEMRKFRGSLSKAGNRAIYTFLHETPSYNPDEYMFGNNLDDPMLDDTTGAVFRGYVENATMAEMRAALFSSTSGRTEMIRSLSALIKDWYVAQIGDVKYSATEMFDLVGNQRLMFKIGCAVPTSFADAFPKLQSWLLPEVVVEPGTLSMPTTPTTPPTTRIVQWEDTDLEGRAMCIETLGTEERKIWDASEAKRQKNMDTMKGEACGASWHVENLENHFNWQRTQQMSKLAGANYGALKRKY
jgi:hypothetical protein